MRRPSVGHLALFAKLRADDRASPPGTNGGRAARLGLDPGPEGAVGPIGQVRNAATRRGWARGKGQAFGVATAARLNAIVQETTRAANLADMGRHAGVTDWV